MNSTPTVWPITASQRSPTSVAKRNGRQFPGRGARFSVLRLIYFEVLSTQLCRRMGIVFGAFKGNNR